MLKLGVITLNSSDDPVSNAAQVAAFVEKAAHEGADIIFTPEVSNCVSSSRAHQNLVLRTEAADETLKALQSVARSQNIWLSIGSLALKGEADDERFSNRSFLIGPDGKIHARYDKIHMFDVEIDEQESYRESAGYKPGERAVVAETDTAKIGLSICYDLRFAHLFRALAQAGAEILSVPAAFSPVSGAAHWEVLLRARAIETGCFVVAAAQTGTHASVAGKSRQTYGHSMVVSPWGEVLLDSGTDPGVQVLDIDLSEVYKARRRIPSLTHDRAFEGPK